MKDERAEGAQQRARSPLAWVPFAMLLAITVQAILLFRWGRLADDYRRTLKQAKWQEEYVYGLAIGYNAAAFACIGAHDGHGQTAEYEKQHITEWVTAEAEKRAGPRPE